MPKRIRLGFSPCPNDTFIFAGLVLGRVPTSFTPDIFLADVEELNQRALKGEPDATKVSVGVLPRILDEYIILSSGAALGFGCGPLLAAREDLDPNELRFEPVAVPGLMTTANLLLSLYGHAGPRVEMSFERIIPAVASGLHRAGLVIHEGRFTFAARGLRKILDLGEWWEEWTNSPLPLGVIVMKRSLGLGAILEMEAAIRTSLEFSRKNPALAAPYIRDKAQEMDPAVLTRHIETFVTDYSLDLGPVGREAVRELTDMGRVSQGLSPFDKPLFLDG